jgi:hypothetical protein
LLVARRPSAVRTSTCALTGAVVAKVSLALPMRPLPAGALWFRGAMAPHWMVAATGSEAS